MTTWITSGGRPSNGRLALQRAGGFRKVRPTSIGRPNDHIINWGCSDFEMPGGVLVTNVINKPQGVRLAANKLRAFQVFKEHEVSCVPWTTDKSEAVNWLEADKPVVCRTKLTGHSGDGIIICEPGDELPDAPLYTRYVFKTHEYRVHVMRNSVIDVQRKIRDPDREPLTWKVRSHANGFIFVRGGVDVSDAVRNLCISTIAALGLDFGAVDVVVDKAGQAYVLEVNTAPGLEGQSVDNYVNAFKGVLLQ